MNYVVEFTLAGVASLPGITINIFRIPDNLRALRVHLSSTRAHGHSSLSAAGISSADGNLSRLFDWWVALSLAFRDTYMLCVLGLLMHIVN